MNALLQQLDLEPIKGKAPLSGLVSVQDNRLPPEHLAEEVALHELRTLYRTNRQDRGPVDYVFFRRFTDGRSPRVAACVVDNSRESMTREDIASLHRKMWLNGSSPLLYVAWPSRVDILRCAAGPDFWDQKQGCYTYKAHISLQVASEVADKMSEQQVRRFSAFRLANGTFWEDPGNADWAQGDKSSHHTLIKTAMDVDREIQKNSSEELKPVMRQLLLLFVFSKYLEDRDVFPKEWFSELVPGATSFKEVLESQLPQAVQKMLDLLRQRFNGDVFNVPDIAKKLNANALAGFVDLLDKRTVDRQMYLWDQYSFRYIPVEVLSHLYQHFAQEGTGAIYTPPFVADLVLDHVLPYEEITGKETVLDPTCGSGVFLVGAFRRLVHHWQSQNNWDRPGVPVLKKILKQSLFGVEQLESAAHVASLNLALAVCDALQPNVIWGHLTFDKLVGSNLFIGDFFENLDALRKAYPEGFSVIAGNPPFTSELTPAALSTRCKELREIPIPDKQMAYRVTEECLDLLSIDGRLCLLQPSGILYNAKTEPFRSRLFTEYTLKGVLDFTSIRSLFEAADTKALALVMSKTRPSEEHTAFHLTFRRTKSVHEQIGFELDHYDFHSVGQKQIVTFPWIWKVNLLGGGRLVNLMAKIMEWPTLKEFVEAKGWTHGEGFIPGKKSAKKQASWLEEMPFLPSNGLSEIGLISSKLGKVQAKVFSAPRTESRFAAPMLLIKEVVGLHSALWLKGKLAFQHRIVSINAKNEDSEDLIKFSRDFDKNRELLSNFCQLKSSEALIGHSTSIHKRDIDNLPWPVEKLIDQFSWWEQCLLEDIPKSYAPVIQVGQNSKPFAQSVLKSEFKSYAETFVRLLGSVYTNLRTGDHAVSNGLAFHAFHFGEEGNFEMSGDWADKMKAILYDEANASFRTARVLRYYEENTLLIIKTDRLRNWIPSTAIRDADETLMDLRKQGF